MFESKTSLRKKILGSNISALILAIVIISIVLTFLSPHYLTQRNITNIGFQTSINAIIAIGMTFVILTSGIDLSVGSLLAFSSVILGFLLKRDVSLFIAIIAALVSGGLWGLVNGLFITKGKVPPFIATLGMMGIARGFALVISDGRPISGFDLRLVTLGSGKIGVLPIPFVIMIACYVLAYFILNNTRLGRYIYTIGGNEEAARLSGIKVHKYLCIAYIISGVASAVAAIILTGRLNSAQAIFGQLAELDAIAAVIIGGTSFSGGEGTIVGTLLGAVIMTIIRNGMNLLNVHSFYQQIVIGLIIIFAVMIDTISREKK